MRVGVAHDDVDRTFFQFVETRQAVCVGSNSTSGNFLNGTVGQQDRSRPKFG